MTSILAHQIVHAQQASPTSWMVFLHGILGSGSNLRSLARAFTDRRPDWGAVLVDLREHGKSQGFEPPHTLARAAADLGHLQTHLGLRFESVLGHSFGGKVALEWVRQQEGDLGAAWILDSLPRANPEREGSDDVLRVLSMLRRLPREGFATRDAFRQRVVGEGFSPVLAQWLATQVEKIPPGHYAFSLNLDAVGALLDDYFHTDRSAVVHHPPGRVVVHLIIAGRSRVFTEDDVQEAHEAAIRSGSRLVVEVLPDASHWVHVDALEDLVALLLKHTPSQK